eukprot:CAMPEP_0116549538 /NCGR_PEP_ID=MMETSP0397-20121206/4936_1 /TAXON_ID=216820 /ORGANISM="Cyclophora tenuis, Strain ECT3854" /LENGTH=110 /DNA_ID=CAMNT_0004074287 /DNA_START=335 /DNA_END=667 /DNA_ORIENTATION=-
MEQDIRREAKNTFVPGGQATKDDASAAGSSFVFTAEQRNAIRQLVENAKTPQEIERIEESVQRGEFPSFALPSTTVTPPSSADNAISNGDSRKRPAVAENGENSEKRQRT